jgi:hypothetical protein
MLHLRDCGEPAIHPFAELTDQFAALNIWAGCCQAARPALSIYTSGIVDGMDKASYQEWFGSSNLAGRPNSKDLCASEQFLFGADFH